MNDTKNVNQFMMQVIGFVNQIRINGENLENHRVVEKILRILPIKFEMVVIALLESKDLSSFSVEELMGSLLSHETRLSIEEGSLEHAFKTQASFSRGRGIGNRGRSKRGKGNHHEEDRSSQEQ